MVFFPQKSPSEYPFHKLTYFPFEYDEIFFPLYFHTPVIKEVWYFGYYISVTENKATPTCPSWEVSSRFFKAFDFLMSSTEH